MALQGKTLEEARASRDQDVYPGGVDLIKAGSVEVVIEKNPNSTTSRIWVNVDGMCLLRVAEVSLMVTDMNNIGGEALRLNRESDL